MIKFNKKRIIFFSYVWAFFMLPLAVAQTGHLKKVTKWYDQEETQKKADYYVLESNPSILSGEYISYYQNGQISSKGQFRNNQTVGEWNYYFEGGGVKIKAQLQNSERGYWIYFYENGTNRMEGRLINGQKVATWKFYYESGQKKSEGPFLKKEKHGNWVCFYETGEKKAEASYEQGTGKYKEFYVNGKLKAEGTVVDNTSEGLWKYYDEDGHLVSQGYERNGVKNGRWKHYHPSSGKVASEGSYLDGNKEESWQYFYENGQLSSEGEYKLGRKEQTWNLYHSDGRFKAKAQFVKGDGIYQEYYKNGKLKVRGRVVYGKNEGKWEYFYEDRKREGNCEFKDGKGNYIGYYPSGDKRIEGKIENGQKVGVWKLYDKKGKIVGFYKTFYDSESRERELGDFVPVKLVGDSLFVDTITKKTIKQKIVDKKKKTRQGHKKLNLSFKNPFSHKSHYGHRWFNYHGYIFGINPFGIATGNLPASLEYFHEQQIGYEIMYFYTRNPFFSTVSNFPDGKVLKTGYSIALKQKFYLPERNSSMVYFAHEFRFLDNNYISNYVDEVLQFENRLTLHEFRYAYTLQFGNRILRSTKNKRGLTFDIYVGLGLGYRHVIKNFDDSVEEYEKIFTDITQTNYLLATRLGFTFGYLF